MIKKVSFKNGRGMTLRGIIHRPKKYDVAVVLCHGFPGSIYGHSSPRFGRLFEQAGFLTLRFNFSHTPDSDGRFENKLMSREVEDIKFAIDFLAKNFKFRKLALVGGSTGAIDASLYAYRDKRVSKLILTGAVSSLRNAVRYDFTDEQVRDFWQKGRIVYNWPGRFAHGKKLWKKFYDEFFTLDIPRAIKKYRRPLLIIHGEHDEIPWKKEAWALYRLANRPKKFVLIGGADHSFHNPIHFRQAAKQMISFIKK
jgi:pimeloyl-ACP methyl ester carboxylesterase